MDGFGKLKKSLALGRVPPGADPAEWLCAGPFCFAGQEKDFPDWERRFSFAPEPLANPARLAEAAKIAQSLCMAAISSLSSKLSMGNIARRPVYWQILLAPFCMDLARQMVERTIRCEAMVEAWGTHKLKAALLPDNCLFHFKNERDFTLRGNLGEKFNHWLFSRILENIWPGRWEKIYLPSYDSEKEAAKEGKKPFTGLKDMLRRGLLNLPFPRLKGMTLAQAALFSNALRHPIKTEARADNLERAYYKPELLERIRLPENWEGIFERCLPLSVRNLKHGKNRAKRAPRPWLRIVSPAAYEDAAYRQRLALWREEGNALAWVQHGGNYGEVRVSCEAELIEYSQSVFFTWGWDKYENTRGNFKPMPYPQLAKIAGAWKGREEKIIFTGAEMAAYQYRLDSHPAPLQYLQYRQWKADFLNAVSPGLREKIWYRPYFSLPGLLADANWLLPRFPEINLCKGPLTPQILDCRLLVLDHHGTTLLEAMAADIPMILFWNRDLWLLTNACERLIDMLEACGVWHSTPGSAARKLMEVWPDTKSWWRSPNIAGARKIFCESQARLPNGNLNKIWIGELRRI